MRRLLRRLGLRYSISIGLIVVIASVVIFARLVGGDRAPVPYPHPSYVPASLDALGDDGVDDDGPDGEPLDYPDDDAVLEIASAFAVAWTHSDVTAQEWLEGLRPRATDELIERLGDVDPSDVPTYAVAGDPTIRSRSEAYADVVVPIAVHDALVLGLVNNGEGWLVASLDRETG